MDNYKSCPFYRDPDHPHFNRRAHHHDYTRPGRYLITIIKNPQIAAFSYISGNPFSGNRADITVSLSRTGAVIPDAIKNWMQKYPIFAEEYAIMPDHIHLCLNVVATLPNGLSRAVANLMGMVTTANWHAIPDTQRSITKIPVFSKGFNDRIAYTIAQWNNQLRYTADNPRRYLIKQSYPDYLLKKWLLTMPDNRLFILKGNIFLLRQPFLFKVKTSRHFTPQEAKASLDEWKRHLLNGGIPISPFIHPHEKQFRDIAANEGFSYIRICTNGFAEREAASGKEFEMMAQGRLLLIGQYAYNTRKEDLHYGLAKTLNNLASEIADACRLGIRFTIRLTT